jgi:hypothetical protein
MYDSGAEPIRPVYHFNEPGQSIVLFEGQIRGLGDSEVPGKVELVCAPRLGIEWSVGAGSNPTSKAGEPVKLLLQRSEGEFLLPGHARLWDEGWSNGATSGDQDSQLERIVAHWFNLPNWNSPIPLAVMTDQNERRQWMGRWCLECSGWKITFDTRRDHGRVWQNLRGSATYMMTHVMELRREDGQQFTARQAKPVIEALHLGISFALGRWAAPMLVVGQSLDQRNVWEEWRVRHCEPARSISLGWWYNQSIDSLGELLVEVIRELTIPGKSHDLKFQMASAIIAVNDSGFVEQRITLGAAGIEHLTWQNLVRDGVMTEKQYGGKALYGGQKLHAASRLRILLDKACIPTDIDPRLLPTAAKFLDDERKRQGNAKLDGADLVVQVRNRLIHPDEKHGRLYDYEGLLTDIWGLTRHYFVLLLLHSLRYNGQYRDLTKFQGFASDVDVVPWALGTNPV